MDNPENLQALSPVMAATGYSVFTLVGASLASFLVSAGTVSIGILLARHIGFVKGYNAISQDGRAVTLGGGISFGAVIVAFSALIWGAQGIAIRVPLSLSAAVLIGTADDIFYLKPFSKLIGQVAVAVIYLIGSSLPIWVLPLAAFYLAATQNAWNMVDVMDGLAAWVTIPCLLGIALITHLAGVDMSGCTLLACVSAGAVGGFLLWNSPPARVFMGDAGSSLLGLLYGVLVIEAFSSSVILGISVAAVGLIPLFELSFLCVERAWKGVPVYLGSPDHFAMRLQLRGLSVQAILFRVAAAGALLVVIGGFVYVFRESPAIVTSLLALLAVLTTLAFRYLHALPTRDVLREPK